MRMEKMLWIEDIVESTQALPFLTNFKGFQLLASGSLMQFTNNIRMTRL
jgi:hypothetical protein